MWHHGGRNLASTLWCENTGDDLIPNGPICLTTLQSSLKSQDLCIRSRMHWFIHLFFLPCTLAIAIWVSSVCNTLLPPSPSQSPAHDSSSFQLPNAYLSSKVNRVPSLLGLSSWSGNSWVRFLSCVCHWTLCLLYHILVNIPGSYRNLYLWPFPG